MRVFVSLLTGVLCSVFPTLSFARDADLKLVNHTGYQIDKVYAGLHSSRSWGPDIMGNNALGDGETVSVSFPRGGSACIYDVYVRYHDGSHIEFDNLNLCNLQKLSLIWDGTATRYAGE